MMVDMKQTFVTDNYQDEGHGHEILVVPFGLVRTLVFISCMSKRLLHMTRESELQFFHHQPYQLGYGKSRHNLRLTAMLR